MIMNITEQKKIKINLEIKCQCKIKFKSLSTCKELLKLHTCTVIICVYAITHLWRKMIKGRLYV